MYRYLIVTVLLVVLISGCSNSNQTSQLDHAPLSAPVIDPQQIATDVINLLKLKDLPRVAAFVHPTEGVRFSPYGYVNPETDIIMQATELQNAIDEETVKNWGSYDGSGQSIELTFAEYYDTFIYDHDFVNADQVGYNTIINKSKSNTTTNIKEIYSESYMTEYHFKGTEANDFMDWSSLIIVLTEYESSWVVIGIIHDQWTI